MQEEIDQKSATLMINGTKFSLRTLKSAVLKLLAHRQNLSAPGVKHRGKQTVRQLVGQNQSVSNIELSGQDLKEFQRITRRYGVDYAIRKVNGDKAACSSSADICWKRKSIRFDSSTPSTSKSRPTITRSITSIRKRTS